MGVYDVYTIITLDGRLMWKMMWLIDSFLDWLY